MSMGIKLSRHEIEMLEQGLGKLREYYLSHGVRDTQLHAKIISLESRLQEIDAQLAHAEQYA